MAGYVRGLFSPKLKATSSSSLSSNHTQPHPPTADTRSLMEIFKDDNQTDAILYLATSTKPIVFEMEDGRTLLHVAARKGWAEVCNALITSHDCDIATQDNKGYTSLHYAVIHHQLKVIELLVSRFSASFLQVDKNGDTPIHLACYYGHQAIVEYIISCEQLDLTVRNIHGDTPLHMSCLFLYMTKFLLSTGSKIDLESKNNSGHTPVQVACLQQRWEVALYLVMEHKCNPMGMDHYGNTLLHELSKRGLKDTLKYIVSAQALNLSHRNSDGDTPLHVACSHAQVAVVEFLMSQEGIDPNCTNDQGFTPAQVAFCQSHWQIGLKLIVEHGSSPVGADKEGNTALHGACMTNNIPAVKHIVSTGSIPVMTKNKNGDSPLHIACYYGNMENVRFLMSLTGCQVKARNYEGNTSLHFASMAGHEDVIHYLIEEGQANVFAVNNRGNTSLHLSCEFGHTRAAKTLVRACGSRLNEILSTRNEQGKTPPDIAINFQRWESAVYMASLAESYVPQIERNIHLFCSEGYFELVKTILETLKVNINCRDRFKNTPLHHACKSGSIDIIQYILTTAKADPACVNELENAPIHTACLEGHLEAVRYLMSMSSVDPNCVNKSLDTPIHMACSRGHYDVVKFLLKSGRVYPFPVNKDGKTPLELVRPQFANYKDMVQLFTSLKESLKQIPVQTYTKVILCGDCGSGKSSLAKVLFERAGNRRRFSKGVHPKKLVTGVKPCTVGMVQHTINTPDDDNIVLFDLSGHPNFHNGHVSYVRHLNHSSPSLFVLVINVKLSDEEIKKRLLYWYGLIASTCNPSLQEKSKVIVVGSHIDKTERKEKERIKALIDDIMSNHDESCPCEYVTLHYLNCSKLYSKRLLPFFNLMFEACKAVKPKEEQLLAPYCNLLYRFLMEKVKEKALTLINLIHYISSEENCLIPTQILTLTELLVVLRNHGLIQLIKPNKFSDFTWIIVDQCTICNEIIGRLFAPPDYDTKCIPTASSIMSVASLEKLFPQVSVHTLAGILCSLQLCYELNTKASTQVTSNLPLTSEPSERERQLLFIGYLPTEEPSGFHDGNHDSAYKCVGWCFFSAQCHPFFSLYLAQMVVFQLLQDYCLPQVTKPVIKPRIKTDGTTIKFKAWRCGLQWVTKEGVNVRVKLKPDQLCFTVTVSYNDENFLQHMKYRSSLVKLVSCILNENCSSFDFKECVVPVSQAEQLNRYSFKDLEFYNFDDISEAVASGQATVSITQNCSAEIKNLLVDDPYLHLSLEQHQKLHDSSLSSQDVPESFVEEISLSCPEIMSKYNSSDSTSSGNTYRSLRNHIDQFSVLANSKAFMCRVSQL